MNLIIDRCLKTASYKWSDEYLVNIKKGFPELSLKLHNFIATLRNNSKTKN